jgi:hypothetical protein
MKAKKKEFREPAAITKAKRVMYRAGTLCGKRLRLPPNPRDMSDEQLILAARIDAKFNKMVFRDWTANMLSELAKRLKAARRRKGK